jgi:DNA-binding beta-propeller fold protein YncE
MRSLVSRFIVACAFSSLVLAHLAAQESVPEIRFDANVNLLKMPSGVQLGEVAGVAINSKHHIFVFVRSGERTTVHGATAAQLFEFGPDGQYLREIGQNLYGFAFAHTVRIDKDDNIWATDEGANMVIKFNPAGRVLMVLGRRAEAVEPEPVLAPGQLPRPQWGGFNRPTDVTWDPSGNIFVADGYNNSRVVKIDPSGRWVKTWGERGKEQGQFNILHSIAADAKGNIYVGDRSNRRIQVFDSNGAFLKQFTIDVPFTKPVNVMLGADPSTGNPLAVSGAPWAICISPSPSQFLYVADAVPGRIYKLNLDGRVVGVLGEAGKGPKQFGWIHEIACPSENELYVAELLNWRMQKLVLHP